jgi:UDPglucose--hexose-1-phosphate uridylyltransferase
MRAPLNNIRIRRLSACPSFQGKSLSEPSELADSLMQRGTALTAWRFHRSEHIGRRVITESDDFVTFIPYAALSPYHLWIFPKAHVACFSAQPLETLAELATTLRTILEG